MQLEHIPCREGLKCLSCNQGPNDIERDLLPERSERVAWERKAKDSTGTAPDNNILVFPGLNYVIMV